MKSSKRLPRPPRTSGSCGDDVLWSGPDPELVGRTSVA